MALLPVVARGCCKARTAGAESPNRAERPDPPRHATEVARRRKRGAAIAPGLLDHRSHGRRDSRQTSWRESSKEAASRTLLLGCEPPQKSAAGFHLPDGDPARGQAAFVALRCHACHEVQGVPLPAPVAQPPLPLALGGRSYRVRTDGELVAAILERCRRMPS